MNIANTSAYKFIDLTDLAALKTYFLEKCAQLNLKGTVLLSSEGINLMLAGLQKDMEQLKVLLNQDQRFHDLPYKDSYSSFVPFKRLFVKIKKEIIPLRQPDIRPQEFTVTHLPVEVFKQWLDENRDITVLDTRNDYEVAYGTFDKAIHLHLKHFADFPQAAVVELDESLKNKPLVMFCTGGVRCEKAGPFLVQQGFKEVYQLEGGILRYFEKCGGAHYQGNCFVFDERVAVDSQLQPIK